jgi:hypothetical protein
MKAAKGFCLLLLLLTLLGESVLGQDILHQYKNFLLQSEKTYLIGTLYGPKYSLEEKWESWDGSVSSVTKRRFSSEYFGVALEQGKFKQSVIFSTFNDFYRYDLSDPGDYDRYGPNNDERRESKHCLHTTSTYRADWYQIGLSLNLFTRSYEHIFEKNYRSGTVVHEEGHVQTKNKVKLLPGLYLRIGKETFYVEAGGANSEIFRPDLSNGHLNFAFRVPRTSKATIRFGTIGGVSRLRGLGALDLFGNMLIPVSQEWFLETTLYRNLGTWGDQSTGLDGMQICLKYKSF